MKDDQIDSNAIVIPHLVSRYCKDAQGIFCVELKKIKPIPPTYDPPTMCPTLWPPSLIIVL